MPKISACIISYNEEAKIEDCLRSLEGVVDEIVLIDSHSTDRTIEIARKFTARIVYQDFLGYIEQKNLAAAEATNDWVLNVDCDERLSPELAGSILAAKEDLDQHAAYEMPRKTFYVYRWLDHCWYPEHRSRLYNRRLCAHTGVNPHEKVELREGTLGRLSGDLLHYSFDNISDHIKTLDRFTGISARDLVAKNKRVTLLTPFIHGLWVFFKLYFIRRGFLDGFAGFTAALLSLVHVFVKYGKILTLRFQQERGQRETALD